ncbi:hypothetical protein ACJRO7_026527 [Eucalyptus globulus]|uniref:Uncharacterized protein n=1 Tax=Eucalyptus globulus TaxID=34317 RepID=A0ABD3JUG1_EUCGL
MSQLAPESPATRNAYASEVALQEHMIDEAVVYFCAIVAIFLLAVLLITGVLWLAYGSLARQHAAEVEARRQRWNQHANRDQPRHVVIFHRLEPGEPYPTHVAQPAPLPCSREGVRRPPREI